MRETASKGLAVRAGSSGGQVVLCSIAAAALWYTFDDRLATLTGVESLGTLPATFVFLIVLFVCVVLSVAGMSWTAD